MERRQKESCLGDAKKTGGFLIGAWVGNAATALAIVGGLLDLWKEKRQRPSTGGERTGMLPRRMALYFLWRGV
jgi:hypothetical protein